MPYDHLKVRAAVEAVIEAAHTKDKNVFNKIGGDEAIIRKLKYGYKLVFPLLDATAASTDEEFKDDVRRCQSLKQKVQALLDRDFGGLIAAEDMGGAYPLSNEHFLLVVEVPFRGSAVWWKEVVRS